MVDTDTHTDTIQTDTYTDIRQIILIEMLCDVILWTSTPVLKRGNGSGQGWCSQCHIQVSHTGTYTPTDTIQTDTYRYKTDYFNLRSLDYRYRYRTIHTPDTELDGEI